MSRTVEHQLKTVADLFAFLQTGRANSALFHLEADNGVIVAIEEQYRP